MHILGERKHKGHSVVHKGHPSPHIFNYPLFKKDKAVHSFLFSPHMRNLTAPMLMFCVIVGRESNPKVEAFPPFLVAKEGSKLDTSTVW